jgi:hypothetical protein
MAFSKFIVVRVGLLRFLLGMKAAKQDLITETRAGG